MPITLDSRFARELPAAGLAWQPAAVRAPELVWFNAGLAKDLSLDAAALQSPEGVAVLAGNAVPAGAKPFAQAYAGHQFGNFSPQLGDGRALLLGEVVDAQGTHHDLALKGSGRTPFSRGGDGRAALGPMLREVLISEALHALGVPTTRSLAVVATGESVYREEALPGAVLSRIAASHLRVGTLQFFAARGQHEVLRAVADHAIARHAPQLGSEPEPYLGLLAHVVQAQAALLAQWMGYGFIHGVMNTDNMALSGQSIDFGPCAFMEAYSPRAVFSSIDSTGRYAYGNQPGIARWNLTRLAEALLPLIHEDDNEAIARATAVLDGFATTYEARWLAVMQAKLGLGAGVPAAEARALAEALLTLLQAHEVDFTLGFRLLSQAAGGEPGPWLALFASSTPDAQAWLARWHSQLPQAQGMDRANPIYIARNHQVERALAAAWRQGDLQPLHRLLQVLASPFEARSGDAEYALPAPREVAAGYRTFCGT